MSNRAAFQAFGTSCRLLGVAVAGAGVAACSPGGSSSFAPTGAQNAALSSHHSTSASSRVRFDARRCPSSVVYVVSSENSAVEMYDWAQLRSGPCGSVTGFASAQGLFVDAKGHLWVTDSAAQQVFEFVTGTQGPILTLDDPSGTPYDVTVDASSGTVYVTDYQNSVNPNTLVEVYAKGSTTPTGTLSDPTGRNATPRSTIRAICT